MSKKLNRWVVYEFHKGQYVAIGEPQPTKEAAEKPRDKLSPFSLREQSSFGDGRVSHAIFESWRNTLGRLMTFEEALISVWRRSLVDKSSTVEIDGEKYPVRTTAKRKLKQVDFVFDGRAIRGLEQNPDTKSRWAKMAREGKKVMQFLENHRYIAVVVDGKLKSYA